MKSILSADIGGTKTLLRLDIVKDNSLEFICQKQYASMEWSNFEQVLDDFINGLKNNKGIDDSLRVDIASFAVAGPIEMRDDHCIADVTNLPWQIDCAQISKQFSINRVYAINDFQAIGYAIDNLPEQNLHSLQKGQPVEGAPKAIIGAGTGLGHAILTYATDNKLNIIASEAGHINFAATTDLEVALFQHLNNTYKHVSYEHVLSGTGLLRVYQFLSDISQCKPTEYHDIIQQNADPAKMIAKYANLFEDSLAAKALSLFFKIYGAQTGNLGLTCIPLGGIYIAGGIARKNLAFLEQTSFMTAFLTKGNMQTLMQKIPVKVITDPNIGLIGAINYVNYKHNIFTGFSSTH